MMVYFIFALNVFQGSSLFANRIVLSLFALELGAQPLTVGLLAALFSLFPALLAVTVGRLADRFGARWLLIAGSLGGGAGMLLPHVGASLWAVLAGGALCGLSLVCCNVTSQNLVGILSNPENRARNFSNYSLSYSGGQLLGPLTGGFLVQHLGAMSSCLSLGLFGLIPAFILLAFMRKPLEAGAEKHTPKKTSKGSGATRTGTLAMLKDPAVRQTCITGSMLSSGLNMYSAYMPVYAHSIGLAPSVIGIVVSMNATAAFVIRGFLPKMVAHFREQGSIAISFMAGAVALMLIPFFESPVILGMLSFMFGIGMGAGQPVITMLMFANSPPGRSGESIGLKVTTNHLTNMVSPIVFGMIATGFGLLPMFMLNGLMLGAGSAFSYLNRRRAGE